MPYNDLREFFSLLEKEGELIRIKDKISPSFEIAAYMRKPSDFHGSALLFENVEGADMKVLGGLFRDRKRIIKS